MNSEIVRRLEESFRREDTRAEKLEDRREMARVAFEVIGYVPKASVTEAQRAEIRRLIDEALRHWTPEEGSDE